MLAGPSPARSCSPAGAPIGRYTSVLSAISAGILHVGIAPMLVIGGVRPNVVLVFVVVITAVFGFGHGIVWAFVAGTTANVLGFEPLGLVPFGLLVAAALVGGAERAVGRLTWLVPLAAAAASVAYDAVALGVLGLLGLGVRDPDPLGVMLPAAMLNAAAAAVVFVPVFVLGRRALDGQAGIAAR
ncbi:MAG: rod shape-determining protein MreD [Candidatus Limnocylindria bacterium]